jgi:hypothetical protein
MQRIYSTEVSLFVHIIPENIDAFVPCWHRFKNSVAAEIGLLHSQPFMNSHFHFLIIVESSTSQMFQRPKQMVCFARGVILWHDNANPTQRIPDTRVAYFHRELVYQEK